LKASGQYEVGMLEEALGTAIESKGLAKLSDSELVKDLNTAWNKNENGTCLVKQCNLKMTIASFLSHWLLEQSSFSRQNLLNSSAS